ncbi:hypothetical protein Holit_00849 [Hollandina sp. SP2]
MIKQVIVFILVIIMGIVTASCASMGRHLPLSSGEMVIGTIQTSFVARETWFSKDEVISTQAYIKLLEAAVKKYPGSIDVRNILWVTGRMVDHLNVEIAAAGMVIALDQNER